jgi:hypothetical protein
MTTIEFNNDDILLKDPNTNLYTCTTCSYYTPLRNSFIKHLKTDKHKINENPLECENCNKLFYTKISFNNHAKSCIIPEINDDIDSESTDETNCDKDYDDADDDQDEDLSVLLSRFGNEYDKLMIKYMLLFLLKIKENMVPVNLLLIFVFFMWTR